MMLVKKWLTSIHDCLVLRQYLPISSFSIMSSVIDPMLKLKLPDVLAEQLEQLSKATGQQRDSIALAALHEYIDTQVSQIQDIQAAVAEADRGEFATDHEVNAFFARYGC
ncbi:hypothetical protein V8J88_09620 [Massilia sp. W12]|uniref:CopG family ribbon-helix-helix protein n=1 Tax=Massilia sp. W12 TaxID=3126507 RepID=UPI0030D2554D